MTKPPRSAIETSTEPYASPAPSTTTHVLEELLLEFPFWRYHQLFSLEPYSFLLDSAKDSEKLGRYSFIGGDPFLVYKAKRQRGAPPEAGANIEVIYRSDAEGNPMEKPQHVRRVADIFDDLRRVLDSYAIGHRRHADHPIPLLSGAVGYFGYEAGYFVEELPDLGADDLNLPDVYLMFVDVVLCHAHDTGKSYLSVTSRGPNRESSERRAREVCEAMRLRIEVFEADPPPEWKGPNEQQAADTEIEVTAHFDERHYCRAVETMKGHIEAGDIFEACMTHRLESPLDGGTPWELYQELRRINPAPFASFLNFPEVQVVSSSPERYLSVTPDGIAESRPIKGTRPRGATNEEDESLRQELFSSIKERAEHVMIVDLVRNDFGRVCSFHTVNVPELMIIEPYATVFQMVSTIHGQLDEGRDALDLIRATFPGGSMTGAPKIEAMKIIDRLEPVKRGIYSGSVGYIDFAGYLDLNIVIRTFIVLDGRCYYNVGGAIVADSDPHEEYTETQDKAHALKMALRNLKAMNNMPP